MTAADAELDGTLDRQLVAPTVRAATAARRAGRARFVILGSYFAPPGPGPARMKTGPTGL